jgi:glycosyltransferase involved in cell wall biosynthesis
LSVQSFAVKVLVLTTSYPRGPEDPAGRFVADAVESVRALGVEVDVVSPSSFRHFGIAYGHGIVGNLKARPWLVLALPAFVWNFRRAARRHDCDLVHAHWLFAGAVAATLGKPFLVQVWGTDVELARRAPWLVRWILRSAQLVIAGSAFLAQEARRLGAREVRLVPTGVVIPESVREPDDPPHVLYVGRLSAEKGIEDFLAATEGLPREIVGAGPIDVPESVGEVPPGELRGYYERAAVVCVPSRREGYGMVAREAMAYARPVVARGVGGLVDAVDDGVTGVIVSHCGTIALRAAIEHLLADGTRARRLGVAGRAKALREWSWPVAAEALHAAYGSIDPHGASRTGAATIFGASMNRSRR